MKQNTPGEEKGRKVKDREEKGGWKGEGGTFQK